jgi:hypothetical protein
VPGAARLHDVALPLRAFMIWTLRLLGESLQFYQDKQPPSRRSLTSKDTARFTDWAGRYDRAVKARNHGELLQIG